MEPIDLLAQHNLKRTSCREGIIKIIMTAGCALSEHEIRQKLEGNYDRTTFYRSFKTLEEKNIIHKIIVDNQTIKYALDHNIKNKNNHAHFYCSVCDTVKCLDRIPVNTPRLPNGYMASNTELIIKGQCNICGKKTAN